MIWCIPASKPNNWQSSIWEIQVNGCQYASDSIFFSVKLNAQATLANDNGIIKKPTGNNIVTAQTIFDFRDELLLSSTGLVSKLTGKIGMLEIQPTGML